jgi:hypothetical protein
MNVSDSEPEKVDSNDEWEEQDPGDLLGPISSSEVEEGVDEEKNEEVEVNNNDMINFFSILGVVFVFAINLKNTVKTIC